MESVTPYLNLIASTAAAVAAWASWKTISITEEISTKPIISVSNVFYSEKNNTLDFTINNLSDKTSDRWARNVHAKILDSKFDTNYKGFVPPDGQISIEFKNIERKDWQEKNLELSYLTFTNKIFKSKYFLPKNEDKMTGEIDIARVG